MDYNYKYRVKISDLWQASMYYAYSSFMGVVNLVCIASAAALIISMESVIGSVQNGNDIVPPVIYCFPASYNMASR